ncbi:MAG: SDR family oxidoreductase [Bacteroidota bacterium]
MDAPILVTGALGNVGREVVNALLAAGQKVRAADRHISRLEAVWGSSVEPVCFDFLDPATFAGTFAGVERMFLMRPPQIANIKRDMLPAIRAAKRAGVKQVVFLSVIGIENMTFIPHSKVESSLKENIFETTFLRCSFFMQNLSTTHRLEIKERSEIFVPVGDAKTSFIDARDIGSVAARILTEEGHAGRNYDITGAEALDYWQAAEILSEVLGRKIEYRNPGSVRFFLETVRRGASIPYALVVTALYTSTRHGMADKVTEEVERLTGKKPISFRQFAEDHKDVWLAPNMLL